MVIVIAETSRRQPCAHLFGDRRRRGEARRLDAYQVDQPREVARLALQDEIPASSLEPRTQAARAGREILSLEERQEG